MCDDIFYVLLSRTGAKGRTEAPSCSSSESSKGGNSGSGADCILIKVTNKFRKAIVETNEISASESSKSSSMGISNCEKHGLLSENATMIYNNPLGGLAVIAVAVNVVVIIVLGEICGRGNLIMVATIVRTIPLAA